MVQFLYYFIADCEYHEEEYHEDAQCCCIVFTCGKVCILSFISKYKKYLHFLDTSVTKCYPLYSYDNLFIERLMVWTNSQLAVDCSRFTASRSRSCTISEALLSSSVARSREISVKYS